LLSLGVFAAGCHDGTTTRTETTTTTTYRRTPATPPPPPAANVEPVRSEAQTLAQLALGIQDAPDGIAEGAAVERMRKWMSDHGLTYQIATFRTDTNMQVDSPSALAHPVRTNVSVYRGRQPVYSFAFVPKDNRNLALLGQ
jgi:hypothetical protein